MARSRIRSRTQTKRKTFRKTKVSYRRKTQSSSGSGVTNQYDKKIQYKKRYMPRYKKRRWRGFINKVHAVAEKELGSRTVLFNSLYTVTQNTNGKHLTGTIALYSDQSTGTGGQEHLNDLNNLGIMENLNSNPTANAGITVEGSTKYMFQSAVLDVTFRNTCFATSAPLLQDSRLKMEVDVYEVAMRIRAKEEGFTYTNLEGIFADNFQIAKSIGGTAGELDYNDRGCTPFELTQSLSRWRIKILKKTKYLLNNQETFTYQMRDPKRRVVTQAELQRGEGFNKPGWTKNIFIIAKLVPGFTLGTASETFQEQLTMGITRKYLYKIEGANDDRTRYVTQTITKTIS